MAAENPGVPDSVVREWHSVLSEPSGGIDPALSRAAHANPNLHCPVTPMSRYSYSRILVTNITVEETRRLLGSLFDGAFERNTLTVGEMEIEVRRNPDAQSGGVEADEFVRWPVQIETEPVTPHGETTAVETVSRILESLWGARAQAVAACDFEDELPWKGGIQRLRDSDDG
ncbi:hypothetical protein ACFYZ6_06545 [Streptomyces rubiginosohelvolus]|uniref:hypothetical protein n=1 Tax=Streptomyces rubiginosohelvolus TaxID=67362 RepID=UPI0036C9BDAE